MRQTVRALICLRHLIGTAMRSAAFLVQFPNVLCDSRWSYVSLVVCGPRAGWVLGFYSGVEAGVCTHGRGFSRCTNSRSFLLGKPKEISGGERWRAQSMAAPDHVKVGPVTKATGSEPTYSCIFLETDRHSL